MAKYPLTDPPTWKVLLLTAVAGAALIVGCQLRQPRPAAPPKTDPFTYHNDLLNELKSSATAIEIGTKAMRATRPKARVRLTDPREIRAVLDNLRIPKGTAGGGQHKCMGHIRFVIKTPVDSHDVEYDHGNGIYPLTQSETPVEFFNLSVAQLEALNALLLRKGFTHDEIGIAPVSTN